MANGSNHYVIGSRRKRLQPTQFAPAQQCEGRTFVDHDGTIYEIVWPRGRLLLSELGRDQMPTEGDSA